MFRKIASAAMAGSLVLSGLIGPMPVAFGATPAVPWDPFFSPPSTVADFGLNTRPFGVAAGDYDGDSKVDLVAGRTTGNIAFVKGNGDGTFQAPVVFAWKQTFFNAWAFAAGDVNGDGKLDVVWGANALSSGCSISPIPAGETCATAGGTTITVNDGDVRVLYGDGDGTFQQNPYYVVGGVLHNAGTLIADIGTDAGSVATGDVDGDGDLDVVAGAVDGTNSAVKLLRNNGGGTFAAPVNLVTEPTSCTTSGATTTCNEVYFPANSTQNSPWGLALSDADGDGDTDLWVGDRALYTYLYRNSGAGSFTLQGSNTAVSSRPNVYLGHDAFRAAVGFTGSLGSGDINGDGRADVTMGLQSGTQTPGSGTRNDGFVLLDVSGGSGHKGFGSLADVGTMARGVTVIDVNGDGYRDVLAAEYGGKVKLLRQLPPVDTDGDGVSDYVDNAPNNPNAARLDMNTDASVNHRDQLDNDFDTVLGNPEDSSTWQRLGDPADVDDDNDAVLDASDNCLFAANASQTDVDADGVGDACDPLDNRDPDGDGVPTGPLPGDPGFEAARAAAIKWSIGDTHFVVRIDALGRFFQNEFTQLMTDAATLSPVDWAAKCWENYDPGDVSATYEPCGEDATKALTLGGGKEVPVTLVTIPKQLWTDPPVVAWINDRNDNPRFELGQHATYHVNNIPVSDWNALPDRNFFSCELCGLTLAESVELLRVGQDTLLGNYGNKWVAESGATSGSPKLDWSTSANPLLSYAPPFNADDPTGRHAVAQLGFKAHSSSVFEEGEAGGIGPIFTPEGSHHEQFDQFGLFHVSADLELAPPDTTGDTYDAAAYAAYLAANTDQGSLTTWLIEEVAWSGRPCNNEDRLGTCSATGGSNRENNTVYQPRWDAWLQLLDFVKNYPDGVAMTMGEVALAKAYDNAPTVGIPDQADADHDGVGDAIDGASLALPASTVLIRNQPGTLSATLTNGDGDPIASQTVTFSFDADGDGTDETHVGTTNTAGLAAVSLGNVTRPVGSATYSAAWDGLRATASGNGNVEVIDVGAAGGTCSSSPAGGTILLAVGSLALSFVSTSNSALVPASGVVLGGSGATREVTITPVAKKSGTAVITLSLSDGVNATSFTVTVIVGSDKNDTLAGTSGADLILGLGGNDSLSGLAGNDLLCGGNGVDTMAGGDGDDTLDGQNGDDVLRGGNDNDILRGGNGNDRLEGESGNDTLTGSFGADFFSGGLGTDTLVDVTPSQGDTTDGT